MDLFLAHFSFSELFCGGLFSHLVENRCMNTYVPVFNFSGRTFFQTTKSSYEKIEAPHLLSRIAKFLSKGYFFYWRTFLLPIFYINFRIFSLDVCTLKKVTYAEKRTAFCGEAIFMTDSICICITFLACSSAQVNFFKQITELITSGGNCIVS